MYHFLVIIKSQATKLEASQLVKRADNHLIIYNLGQIVK